MANSKEEVTVVIPTFNEEKAASSSLVLEFFEVGHSVASMLPSALPLFKEISSIGGLSYTISLSA